VAPSCCSKRLTDDLAVAKGSQEGEGQEQTTIMFRTKNAEQISSTIVSKESKTCLCAVVDEIRQPLEKAPCKGRSLDLDETQYFAEQNKENRRK
jgi:hypothetical protein